jgi:hypothetical protein
MSGRARVPRRLRERVAETAGHRLPDARKHRRFSVEHRAHHPGGARRQDR